MFPLCEYPTRPKSSILGGRGLAGFNGKLSIRFVEGYDAPVFLQLNWEEYVLWRMTMKYPE